MGVLQKITKEYFGDEAREEDGKFIEVRGFNVLVPIDFDEEKFLHALDDFLSSGDAEFVNKRYLEDQYLKVPCGKGDFYIELDPLGDFRDNLLYDLNDKQIESMLKFLEYLFEGTVDIDTENGKEYVVLMDTSDFDYEIYNADMNDWESQECWDSMKEMFFEEFKDADIDDNDLHCIHYYSDILTMKVTDGDRIILKTILYIKDMVKWWKEQMDEIKKQGARQYFGYESEEE